MNPQNSPPVYTDAAALLAAILASRLYAGPDRPPISVLAVLSSADEYQLHAETLKSHGVVLTEGRTGIRRPVLDGKKAVFLDMDRITRYLLGGRPDQSRDYRRLLRRLPGAKSAQRLSVGGLRVWGIEIPVRDWVDPSHPERWLPLIVDQSAAAPAAA